jgi:hypothetical protein
MNRILHGATFGTIVVLALSSGFAAAQTPCPEGRTGGGDCVNPRLAESARRSAVVFAQPKLSYTAFPVLPSSDSLYRYPNQLIPDPLKPAPLGPFILGQGGKIILVP